MLKLVSAGRTTTLSTNKVRPTAAETALSAFFPPLPQSLFRGLLANGVIDSVDMNDNQSGVTVEDGYRLLGERVERQWIG
jgi:hypothetical protein